MESVPANNKNLTIGLVSLLAAAAIFVAVYFYVEDRNKKIRIVELEEDRLKLILDALRRHPNLSTEVKIQLEKLIHEFKDLDLNVAE